MRKGIVFFTSMLCSIAHAGGMGSTACQDENKVHCERSTWQLGVQALYLQPRYSGYNQFGVLSTTPVGGVAQELAFQAVNDTWGWGFRIEAGYNFHNENDINLNWSSYNVTTNHGTIVIPVGSSFTDSQGNGYNAGTISTSRRPNWDAVNAEFGQILHLGTYNDLRLHGGVQYARINTLVSLSETGATDSNPVVTQNLSYNGVGPRLGIDMGYHLWPALMMYANGAAGILIGPSHFNDTGTGGFNTLKSVTGSTTAIVPELEVKLGAKYIYAMARGKLSFDLGWMWNNYFSSQVNNHSTDTHESDFGLQGLFFGLIWQN